MPRRLIVGVALVAGISSVVSGLVLAGGQNLDVQLIAVGSQGVDQGETPEIEWVAVVTETMQPSMVGVRMRR